MMLSAEQGLALGFVAFYLFDCLRLAPPETVYFLRNARTWSYRVPQQRWRLGSKSVEMLNPFLPWQLPLAARLLPDTQAKTVRLDKAFLPAVSDLLWPQRVLAALVLLAMPAAVIRDGLGVWFLLCLGLIYTVLGYGLFLVRRRAAALQLRREQWLSLCMECVFCPPFAVNLIRKIAAQQEEITDAVDFASRNLDRESLNRWRIEIGRFAQQQLQWYEPGDGAHRKWQVLLGRVGGKADERV